MIGADLLFKRPPDFLYRIALMPAVGGQITDQKAWMVAQPTAGHLALMNTGVVYKQQDRPSRIELIQLMQAAQEFHTALASGQPIVPVTRENVEKPEDRLLLVVARCRNLFLPASALVLAPNRRQLVNVTLIFVDTRGQRMRRDGFHEGGLPLRRLRIALFERELGSPPHKIQTGDQTGDAALREPTAQSFAQVLAQQTPGPTRALKARFHGGSVQAAVGFQMGGYGCQPGPPAT